MSTKWSLRCPHGHTNYVKNVMSDMHGPEAGGEYRCKTCRGQGRSYHYHRKEMEQTPPADENVSLGYVWSPSHDE